MHVPKQVGFRLDDYFARKLADAAARVKMPPGPFARHLVMEALEDTERVLLRQELKELRDEVARIRDHLATAVTALLVDAGNVETVADAEEWVRENLR